MTVATALPTIGPAHFEVLRDLSGIPGADVWDRPDAGLCRDLEKLGLVRIVRARNAPSDGAKRQPYFGVKIKAAGRNVLRTLGQPS